MPVQVNECCNAVTLVNKTYWKWFDVFFKFILFGFQVKKKKNLMRNTFNLPVKKMDLGLAIKNHDLCIPTSQAVENETIMHGMFMERQQCESRAGIPNSVIYTGISQATQMGHIDYRRPVTTLLPTHMSQSISDRYAS